MTLSDLVEEQLKLATVHISQPYYVQGEWEVGEMGIVVVTVINSTGMPLRDLTIELSTFGVGYVSSGPWTVPALEPGSTTSVFFGIAPQNPGPVYLIAWLSAEVVPYGGTYSTTPAGIVS